MEKYKMFELTKMINSKYSTPKGSFRLKFHELNWKSTQFLSVRINNEQIQQDFEYSPLWKENVDYLYFRHPNILEWMKQR